MPRQNFEILRTLADMIGDSTMVIIHVFFTLRMKLTKQFDCYLMHHAD